MVGPGRVVVGRSGREMCFREDRLFLRLVVVVGGYVVRRGLQVLDQQFLNYLGLAVGLRKLLS